MRLFRFLCACSLVTAMAVAQESRPASAPAAAAAESQPASQPTSRPTNGSPFMKLAVGTEIRYEGDVTRHFETPDGQGDMQAKVHGRCVVLSEEKPGMFKLAWITHEEIVGTAADVQPQRAMIFFYDAKAQSLVEAPGETDLPAVAQGSGLEDRPPFPRFFAEELKVGLAHQEEREVDSGGIGISLRLVQDVKVTAATAPELKSMVVVTVTPRGKGPFHAKISMPHVPEGAEVKIEGIDPVIGSAKEEYVIDLAQGRLVSASIMADLDLNEDVSLKTTTEIKEAGRSALAEDVVKDIAAATTEIHAALRLLGSNGEAAKKSLEGFEARHPKAGMDKTAASVRQMADMPKEEDAEESGDEGDGARAVPAGRRTDDVVTA